MNYAIHVPTPLRAPALDGRAGDRCRLAHASSGHEGDGRLVVGRGRIRPDGRGGDGSPRAGGVDVDVVAGPDPRREGCCDECPGGRAHDEGCARQRALRRREREIL